MTLDFLQPTQLVPLKSMQMGPGRVNSTPVPTLVFSGFCELLWLDFGPPFR